MVTLILGVRVAPVLPPAGTDPSHYTHPLGLPTPIKVDVFLHHLVGYNMNDFLELSDGLRYGFSLHSSPPEGSAHIDIPNAKSCDLLHDGVEIKIQKEIALQRIDGPYYSVPHDKFRASPLAARLKSDGITVRLLTNLSAPYDGTSVNANIPRNYSKVKYPSVLHAVRSINSFNTRFGSAYCSKTDIQNAFRLLAVKPEERYLQGFIWDDLYYMDKNLIMGTSSSPRTFCLFSNALKWMATHKFGIEGDIIVYMDDILITNYDYLSCLGDMNKFTDMCSLMGVPLAAEKTTKPSTIVTFLGITLNTATETASLPPDKIQKLTAKLDRLISNRRATIKELQSALGSLNYCCSIIPHGRAFCRRIIEVLKTKQKAGPNYFNVPYECVQDLLVWKIFISHFNSIPFRPRDRLTQYTVHTDSAKSVGMAVIFGSRWYYEEFPESWKSNPRMSIEFLELFPIWAFLETNKDELAGSNITFCCDNSAVVYVINKMSARNPLLMVLLRKLFTISFLQDIQITASHIKGELNLFADTVSRGKLDLFFRIHPSANQFPDQLSDVCQPKNFRVPPHLWSNP